MNDTDAVYLQDEPDSSLLSVILSALAAWVIASLCGGVIHLASFPGVIAVPALSYALIGAAAAGGLLGWRAYRFRIVPKLDPLGFAFGVVLLVATEWLDRPYNLFQGPLIRGELFFATALAWLLLRTRSLLVWHALPVFGALLLGISFFTVSKGALLLSDDHASFVYRLLLLRENFPFIPFYNPLWNAGVDARDFFATGALSPFLMFLPLWYVWDPAAIYNFVIVAILFGLAPLCIYLAARIEGFSSAVCSISATLSLATSLLWYRWGLAYGTLGFITTTSLLPLVLSMIGAYFDSGRPWRARDSVLLVVAGTLMILWTPTGLTLVPAFLLALLRLPTLVQRPHLLRIVGFGALINLPWLALFWTVSNVGSFLTSHQPPPQRIEAQQAAPAPEPQRSTIAPGTVVDAPAEAAAQSPAQGKAFKHRAGGFSFKRSLKSLRETAVSTNPLLLFLIVPGLTLLGAHSIALWVLTSAWLFFLGTAVVAWKPQLELDRMLLVLAHIGCVPAGAALTSLAVRFKESRIPARLAIACAFGFLLLGPFVAGAIVYQRTLVPYSFADKRITDIQEAIREHAGAGRVAFSGFVLHELSNSHLAPLALWTRTPLVAMSPMHDQWRYVDLIPKDFFVRGEEGIEEYFTLMNATAVFAHEKSWRGYFSSRPALYRRVWGEPKFELYERYAYSPTYFAEGRGEILEQTEHGITVRADSSDLLLKFRYFPFLRVRMIEGTGCALEPVSRGSLTLVAVKGCTPGARFGIRSVGPLGRLLDAR